MDSKQHVMLPSELVERCRRQGELIVRGYDRGDNPNSLAVSSHGAEHDPVLQAHSKMGECVFCLWAGLDPLRALRWSAYSDPGFDAIYQQLRVDVKTTAAGRRYLIWPVRKRHIYQSKPFDVLVLVKGDAPFFTVHRWITKQCFFEDHKVADEAHALTTGTWYMHERDLWPMYELELAPPKREAA